MTCPLPRYWMCHIVVVIIIAVAIWPASLEAGLWAGVAFYFGREITQWEQGGGPGLPFDWPGLIAPVAACAIIYILSTLI